MGTYGGESLGRDGLRGFVEVGVAVPVGEARSDPVVEGAARQRWVA